MDFRKHCPIYINTLNIFRPLKTWWKNRDTTQLPHMEFSLTKKSFDWIKENFYTWYWWDHIDMWDFSNKSLIILIDDVQYKYTFGMRELESIPFIFVRLFGWNLMITFNAPNNESNYKYWEQLK